jgi:hypothetical protein
MMLPESDYTDHMLGNAENQDNTEEEAIEHKEREMSKERVTIDDFNIMMQMNISQLALQEQEQLTANQPSTHGYNLRDCPTKWKLHISLAVAEADRTTGVGE